MLASDENMNKISLSQPTAVTQAKGARQKLFIAKCGVLFAPNHNALFWSKLSWTPIAGLALVVLHPTVASALGHRASRILAILAIVLLLPACRKIAIAPFVAILVACVFIGIQNSSATAIAIALPTYALFHLITYDTARLYRAILIVVLIAGILALLQFLIPSHLLNIYATADSVNHFLDQYRPTSIFPSQAYYNQLLFLLIPLFFLVGEKRIWILTLSGFSAAITGSTAGLFFVASSLLLGLRRAGLSVAAGFSVAIAMMAVFYPERLMYNFSLRDQVESLGSRLYGSPIGLAKSLHLLSSGSPTELKLAMMGTLAGHPTLLIAVQDFAISGVLVASMMAVRMAIPLSDLFPFVAAVLVILAGQMIHATMGSMYSSLTLAVLAAIIWNFVTLFTKQTGQQIPHGLTRYRRVAN